MDYESGEEPFALNFNGERAYEDNIIAVKINGTTTRMLTDSREQSTVLSKQQFHNLVRSGLRANLISEERNLSFYGNGCLPMVGSGNCSHNTGQCLLGSPAVKRLQVPKVGPELANLMTVYFVGNDINGIVGRFLKMFSGLGKLSRYQLKLRINREVAPVAQTPRWMPYPLKDKVQRKIDELLNLDVIEKVLGQQPGSAQL